MHEHSPRPRRHQLEQATRHWRRADSSQRDNHGDAEGVWPLLVCKPLPQKRPSAPSPQHEAARLPVDVSCVVGGERGRGRARAEKAELNKLPACVECRNYTHASMRVTHSHQPTTRRTLSIHHAFASQHGTAPSVPLEEATDTADFCGGSWHRRLHHYPRTTQRALSKQSVSSELAISLRIAPTAFDISETQQPA
jgi:hypothetical protein